MKNPQLKECLQELQRSYYANQAKHSKKPDEAKTRIVRLFGDIPRIELFAREKIVGWDVWGNEVNSSLQNSKIKRK